MLILALRRRGGRLTIRLGRSGHEYSSLAGLVQTSWSFGYWMSLSGDLAMRVQGVVFLRARMARAHPFNWSASFGSGESDSFDFYNSLSYFFYTSRCGGLGSSRCEVHGC